jgi:hypothetical protein
MAVSGGSWWSLADSDQKVIRATKINDFKGIAQKLLRLQDGIWQIGRVAFWAQNWFESCHEAEGKFAE